MLHDPHSDVEGKLISQKSIAIIDGTGQDSSQGSQHELENYESPKVWDQRLMPGHVGHDRVNNQAGHGQHGEGNQRRENSEHRSRDNDVRSGLPDNAKHRRYVSQRLYPLAPRLSEAGSRFDVHTETLLLLDLSH